MACNDGEHSFVNTYWGKESLDSGIKKCLSCGIIKENNQICNTCKGTGHAYGEDITFCEDCEGKGNKNYT